MKNLAICAAIAVALGSAACSEQSDPEIIADANEAISDEDVPGSIRVASNDGVVTLTGIVPTMHAKTRAQEVVKDVAGVDRVVNNLRTTAGDAPVPGTNDPMRDDRKQDDLRRDEHGAPVAPPDAGLDRDTTDPMIPGEPPSPR